MILVLDKSLVLIGISKLVLIKINLLLSSLLDHLFILSVLRLYYRSELSLKIGFNWFQIFKVYNFH